MVKIKKQEILSEHMETLFYCEGCQVLEQVAQSGCQFSVLWKIQNPAGRGCEKPALDKSTWTGGWTWWYQEAPYNLNILTILWSITKRLCAENVNSYFSSAVPSVTLV